MSFTYRHFHLGLRPGAVDARSTQSARSSVSSPSEAPAPRGQGYPFPGPQETDANGITEAAFFTDACGWQAVESETFDHIVIGTGPTGVAFVEQALRNNPHARILVLERGRFWLPVHYQMLPRAFTATTGSPPTTYPWSRSTAMASTGARFFQAGYIPVVGGRSTYWSAWCPAPDRRRMRGWPEAMIAVTEQPGFWDRARRFLHVEQTDQIDDGVYGALQSQLDARLKDPSHKVPTAMAAYAAPIAVAAPEWKTVSFYKYSTVGTLLNLHQTQAARAQAGEGAPLRLVDGCVVERLDHDGSGRIIALQTSRGPLAVGDANVVLAMGSIPPATLLMNSFGDALPNAGQRYTGHFMSHVTARAPRAAFGELSDLELAATYLDGEDEQGLQYHVQTSAFAERDPIGDAVTTARELPDAAAAPTMAQLLDSKDHVVFVCATLGEVDEQNPDNWIRKNQGVDPTTNITLQLLLGDRDRALWDTLDKATYAAIEAMATPEGGEAPTIEYWIDDADGGHWSTDRPDASQIRLNIIVHEASALWVGEDPATSVVGLDYRPHGVSNCYVTGGALFPTSGSWNPTLTMCGLAQDLADRIEPAATSIEAGR